MNNCIIPIIKYFPAWRSHHISAGELRGSVPIITNPHSSTLTNRSTVLYCEWVHSHAHDFTRLNSERRAKFIRHCNAFMARAFKFSAVNAFMWKCPHVCVWKTWGSRCAMAHHKMPCNNMHRTALRASECCRKQQQPEPKNRWLRVCSACERRVNNWRSQLDECTASVQGGTCAAHKSYSLSWLAALRQSVECVVW